MKKKIFEFFIASIVVFLCYLIPYCIMLMFFDVGILWPLLMFWGGNISWCILSGIEQREFKKTVAKEFEKSLIEQEQFYNDKLNGISLDIIKQLKKDRKK